MIIAKRFLFNELFLSSRSVFLALPFDFFFGEVASLFFFSLAGPYPAR